MLLRDVKERLYPTPDLEKHEYIIHRYAVEILDAMIDNKKTHNIRPVGRSRQCDGK